LIFRGFRKELQKDVEKLKKKIRLTLAKPDPENLEIARKMFSEWMNLLDELLIVPGHQVQVVFMYTKQQQNCVARHQGTDDT
jgi:hypothetical protein